MREETRGRKSRSGGGGNVKCRCGGRAGWRRERRVREGMRVGVRLKKRRILGEVAGTGA